MSQLKLIENVLEKRGIFKYPPKSKEPTESKEPIEKPIHLNPKFGPRNASIIK
jgi:hypothetical protein